MQASVDLDPAPVRMDVISIVYSLPGLIGMRFM